MMLNYLGHPHPWGKITLHRHYTHSLGVQAP